MALYAIITFAPADNIASDNRVYAQFSIENRTQLMQIKCLASFIAEATIDAHNAGYVDIRQHIFDCRKDYEDGLDYIQRRYKPLYY